MRMREEGAYLPIPVEEKREIFVTAKGKLPGKGIGMRVSGPGICRESRTESLMIHRRLAASVPSPQLRSFPLPDSLPP